MKLASDVTWLLEAAPAPAPAPAPEPEPKREDFKPEAAAAAAGGGGGGGGGDDDDDGDGRPRRNMIIFLPKFPVLNSQYSTHYARIMTNHAQLCRLDLSKTSR